MSLMNSFGKARGKEKMIPEWDWKEMRGVREREREREREKEKEIRDDFAHSVRKLCVWDVTGWYNLINDVGGAEIRLWRFQYLSSFYSPFLFFLYTPFFFFPPPPHPLSLLSLPPLLDSAAIVEVSGEKLFSRFDHRRRRRQCQPRQRLQRIPIKAEKAIGASEGAQNHARPWHRHDYFYRWLTTKECLAFPRRIKFSDGKVLSLRR